MRKRARFERLLDEHKDRVFGYAWYLLQNREDAEDVTQQVFVALWRHLDTVIVEKTRSWIMRVAHNQCMDVIRKRKRGEVLIRFDESNDLPMEAIHGGPSDPLTDLELSEEQRLVLSSLNRIGGEARSMILMHYYEGVPYEEISDRLGVSLSKVKVGIHRAKKRLKAYLKERHPGLVMT